MSYAIEISKCIGFLTKVVEYHLHLQTFYVMNLLYFYHFALKKA